MWMCKSRCTTTVHLIFEQMALKDNRLLVFQGSTGLPGVPGADGQKVKLSLSSFNDFGFCVLDYLDIFLVFVIN